MKNEINPLRGDGRQPPILIIADNLAEATYKSIIACHDYGARIETPKHRLGMSLGYDANMLVHVNNPDSEPKICYPGIVEDGRGILQYILEVTHGIHNHWLKSKEHPEFWGYTYNQRIVNQLPFVFQRIKHDWDKNKRITGRDYNFTTWVAGDDIVLDQEDPPCWQRGQFKFHENQLGEIVMNYLTDWRSRDLLKAWNENNVAQIELMKLAAKKVSSIIGVPVKLGAYTDRSSSLHLYGLYVDRDNLEGQIIRMKGQKLEDLSTTLEDYFSLPDGNNNSTSLKRVVAAQMDYEIKTGTMNASYQELMNNGYDLKTFKYPSDWDTWPKEWDVIPQRDALPRVP